MKEVKFLKEKIKKLEILLPNHIVSEYHLLSENMIKITILGFDILYIGGYFEHDSFFEFSILGFGFILFFN